MTEQTPRSHRPLQTPTVDCGHLNISIDYNGVWYYHGSPINRQELVCLFASVLSRDEDGSYWLVTPGEAGRIDVADVPFLAVELYAGGRGADQVVSIRTNVDEIVTVDGDHPLRTVTDVESGEPTPYVMVRRGLEARLTRAVFYELVALGVEKKIGQDVQFGVWSSGHFFPLGNLAAGD